MGAEMKTVGYIILIEAKATQDKTSEAMSYGYPNETDSEMLLRRGRATLFESYEETEQALKETLLAATAQNSKWPEKFIYKIVPVEVTAPQRKSEQEPVAWMREDEDCTDCIVWEQTEEHTIPLYTTPPQREWVGLTDEEKHDCYLRIDVWSRCVEMVENKLREKNG
jgi:hypothetical protein